MGASDSTFRVRYRGNNKNESGDQEGGDMSGEKERDSMENHAHDDHSKTVILLGASVRFLLLNSIHTNSILHQLQYRIR